jgi:hypothetical protein
LKAVQIRVDPAKGAVVILTRRAPRAEGAIAMTQLEPGIVTDLTNRLTYGGFCGSTSCSPRRSRSRAGGRAPA